MKIKSPLPSLLSSRQDLARMMGLPACARRKDISAAFGHATQCDAWLDIVEEDIVARQIERWTVRVIRGLPKCRIELRQDTRGPWVRDPDEIPQEVLNFLEARIDRAGNIVTGRSWRTWEACRWMRGRGRRLKSRAGEILAVVEIPDVARPTGEKRERIVLDPLCIEDPELSQPVCIPLPAAPGLIFESLEKFRANAYGMAV